MREHNVLSGSQGLNIKMEDVRAAQSEAKVS